MNASDVSRKLHAGPWLSLPDGEPELVTIDLRKLADALDDLSSLNPEGLGPGAWLEYLRAVVAEIQP